MANITKALREIDQRDNSKLQSGYVSRIKGTGLEKPVMVMGYSEQVKDGDKTYTVTVKNYVWKKGFIVPVGPYRKQDHETMIFIKDNATGKTNAITYSHHERVYWSNVKQDKNGNYSVKMPTSWHTPILESGTYEKKSFGGRKNHIGRRQSNTPRARRNSLSGCRNCDVMVLKNFPKSWLRRPSI